MHCKNTLALNFTYVKYYFLLQDLDHCCLETAVMGEPVLSNTLYLQTDIHPQKLK